MIPSRTPGTVPMSRRPSGRRTLTSSDRGSAAAPGKAATASTSASTVGATSPHHGVDESAGRKDPPRQLGRQAVADPPRPDGRSAADPPPPTSPGDPARSGSASSISSEAVPAYQPSRSRKNDFTGCSTKRTRESSWTTSPPIGARQPVRNARRGRRGAGQRQRPVEVDRIEAPWSPRHRARP